MSRVQFIILGILAITIVGTLFFAFQPKQQSMQPVSSQQNPDSYRYVAIGDSYTIGNGLGESERWPNMLAESLRSAGIPVDLVANPAVSGWTTRMAIQDELPVVQREQPNFVTVLIGANDAFGGREPETFRGDLEELLDGIIAAVPEVKILLVTIPDYPNSPAASGYNPLQIRSETQRLEQYNKIIKEEAKERKLPVADIYPASQRIARDESMFIPDGLHPSAKQTRIWEEVIRPVAIDYLKQ